MTLAAGLACSGNRPPRPPGFGNGYPITLAYDAAQVRTGKVVVDGKPYVRVAHPRITSSTRRVNSPLLPQDLVTVALPPDATNVRVFFQAVSAATVATGRIQPVPPDEPTSVFEFPKDGLPYDRAFKRPPVVPDEQTYAPGAPPYPRGVATLEEVTTLFGARVAVIRVSPFVYYPSDERTELRTSIRGIVTFDSARPAQKLYADLSAPRNRALANIVANPIVIAQPQPATLAVAPLGATADFVVSDVRPSHHDRVDYVIITQPALASAFQPLADWKTSKGVDARIVTVDWIETRYAGVDLANKIRNFILDATAKWGASWFLLGGDVAQVPARLGVYDIYTSSFGPSDLYFSGHGNFWNANGNHVFGEGSEPDIYPDVFVGRASVTDAASVATFVSKVKGYEINPPAGYGDRSLLMGVQDNLNSDWIKENQIKPLIPGVVQTMYDSGSTLAPNFIFNQANAITEVSAGYHIVNHLDHSGINSLGTGSHSGGGALGLTDADALTNGIPGSILWTYGCDPNAFDYDAVSEHLMRNPSGGTVAFIGNSRTGWTYQSSQDQQFFKSWFVNHLDNLGAVFSTIQGSSGTYASGSMNLLGDPSMSLWNTQPATFTVSGLGPMTTGANALNLSVTGLASGAEATVTFRSQNGDVYAGGTTSSGVLNGTLVVHSLSPLDVVITSRDRRPLVTTLPVSVSPNAHLYVSGLQIIDTAGTANSQLEPGESATLRITIVNGGGATSVAGTATLATSTSDVTISSNTQPLSALAQSISQVVDFPIVLTNGFADGAALLFTLTTNGAGTEQTSVHVPVFAPVIEQTQKYSENLGNGDDIPTAGDVLLMELHVINNGFGDAHQLAATLSTTSPQITITDSTSTITTVAGKDSLSPGDPFGLTLASGFNPNTDLVTLTMTDFLGNTWTRTIKLVVPPPPTGVAYRSSATSITPLWDASALAIDRNYKVYRSPVFNAPVKLETFLVRDGAYYEDTAISSSQSTYFYDVATIDSYGNESMAAQVQTWVSLPVVNGFPRPIDPAHGTITGHTVVYDVNGDGQKEIFVTTGDPGVLYAWKSDGNEFIPGWDPNFAEFAMLDGSNGGAPAFADLDQDGATDIIVNGKNRIYAFKADGSAVAGWSGGFAVPNLCNGTPPAVGASSPAVGDLNGDGLPEVITTSFDWTNYACGSLGHVYVLDHTGVLTATYTLPNGNYSYATPALADLDGDLKLEAVIPVSTGEIYVLNTAANTFVPIATIPGAVFRNEATLADLDSDGALDVIVASQSNDRIYAVKLDGTPANGWAGGLPLDAGDHMISQWSYSTVAAVGDVDCDDRPEVALGTEQHVYLWEHDGTRKNGWPVLRENKPGFAASAASPLITDVNGDGRLDVVMSSSTLLDTGLIYAWDGRTGAAISAFPQSLPEMISRTGTLGDIDGDGFVDLVQGAGTHMYAFRTDGRAFDVFQPWPRIDRDASNTSTLPAQDLGAACCTPPPPALASWWPLNETSGAAAADLAGGHDGMRQNGVASVAGIVGAAASFNGTNGYVTVPHDPALDLPSQFTIDFWIRPDLGETQGTIYRKGALAGASAFFLAGAGFHLYYSSGHFLGLLSGTSGGIQTDFSPPLTDHADPGKWTFVALAIDQTAATSTLYIDGHLANTQPLGNVGSMANTRPVLMGGADIAPNAARNFAGVLDEVEFTPRALTLAEVEAMYAAGPAGKCGSVECLGTRTLRIGSGDGYAAFHPDPLGAMFGCNPSGAGDASLNGIRFDPPGPIPESNFSCTSMLYVFDQAGTRRQLLSIHDAPTNNCPCTANPGPAGACYYEPLCPPNDVAHMTCADVLSDTGVVAVSSTQMQRITEFTMPNFPGLVVRLVQDGFKDRLVQRYEFTNNTVSTIHLRLSRVGDLDVNYIDDGNGNLIPDAMAYTKNVPAFVTFGAEVHDNLPTPQVHVRITAPSGSDATFEGVRLQGNGGSAQGRTWWNYGVPPTELGLYGLDSDYWFTTWTGDPATPSAADQAIVIQSLLTIPAGQTRTYATETSLQ